MEGSRNDIDKSGFIDVFNNISVVSWWSVLLVEGTRVPGENNRPATSDLQKLYHIKLYQI